MSDINLYTHGFKVHVPNLLNETFINAVRPKDLCALRVPLNIFCKYLDSLATRCSELNDPVLNRLMVEMSIFTVGDPESEDFDHDVAIEVIKKGQEFIKNQKGK